MIWPLRHVAEACRRFLIRRVTVESGPSSFGGALVFGTGEW
jgi:hypothetical protein